MAPKILPSESCGWFPNAVLRFGGHHKRVEGWEEHNMRVGYVGWASNVGLAREQSSKPARYITPPPEYRALAALSNAYSVFRIPRDLAVVPVASSMKNDTMRPTCDTACPAVQAAQPTDQPAS